MKQTIFLQDLHVDDNRQLHISIPPELGRTVKVLVWAEDEADAPALTDEAVFQLAAYAAITESNPEEDAIWEQYVR